MSCPSTKPLSPPQMPPSTFYLSSLSSAFSVKMTLIVVAASVSQPPQAQNYVRIHYLPSPY